MRTRTAAFAAVLLPLVLAACDEDRCDEGCPAIACIDPFVLAVTDSATGEPVSGASATSPALSCSPGPLPASVQCDARAGGTFAVTISAAGYVAEQVTVTADTPVPPDACGCPVCQGWQPRSVELAPAG